MSEETADYQVEAKSKIMNDNVSSAIFSLEQEVLRTLLDGPLQPARIASILGTDVFRESPTTGKKRQHNPLIRGILWGLEKKELVKQDEPKSPWELTELGRRKLAEKPTESQENIERLDQLEEAVAFLTSLYLEKGGTSTVIEFLSSAFHSGKLRNFKERVDEVNDVRKLINLLLKQ